MNNYHFKIVEMSDRAGIEIFYEDPNIITKDRKPKCETQNGRKKSLLTVIIIVQLLTLFVATFSVMIGVFIILQPHVITAEVSTCPCGDGNVDQLRADDCLNSSLIISSLSNSSSLAATAVVSSLTNVIETLSDLNNISLDTAGSVNDALSVIMNISDLQNLIYQINFLQVPSCNVVKMLYPNALSGYYFINGREMYCHMEQLCGSGEGWTRIAYLNMTNTSQSCPSGFRLYESGNVRACGRLASTSGCSSSLKFESNGISYSEICGKVIGYQKGTPDAVNIPSDNINIDTVYADGISITRGSPRQHVWTFISGPSQANNDDSNCPCNSPAGVGSVPSFVGNDYFCESGNPGSSDISRFYSDDPLWDGECQSNEVPCCSADGIPWFHQDYGDLSTTDYIELRICCNEQPSNEDVTFSHYEIYIK
jgi:hypothetical protein